MDFLTNIDLSAIVAGSSAGITTLVMGIVSHLVGKGIKSNTNLLLQFGGIIKGMSDINTKVNNIFGMLEALSSIMGAVYMDSKAVDPNLKIALADKFASLGIKISTKQIDETVQKAQDVQEKYIAVANEDNKVVKTLEADAVAIYNNITKKEV